MATLAESFLADLDDLADDSGEEEDLEVPDVEANGAEPVRIWLRSAGGRKRGACIGVVRSGSSRG